ncbi:MAG TPA: M48 family metallopeptidase, partial [Tenericutes bacterium]|nr:M48 family metallopeptidase [Mycoplasmatota bacterium]
NWKEKIEKRKKINKGFYYLGEKSAFLKLNSLDPNFDIDAWYKNQAEIIFKERLDKIFSHFEEKIPYPKLKIKKLKSKWGSCSIKTNSITLNQELIKYSIDIIDYVIIHELCHFIISNHSKHFWKYVKKYSPNYKDLRKNLRKGLIK